MRLNVIVFPRGVESVRMETKILRTLKTLETINFEYAFYAERLVIHEMNSLPFETGPSAENTEEEEALYQVLSR